LIQQDSAGEIVEGADGKTRDQRIVDIFKQYLDDEEMGVRIESLKDDTVPAMALFSEQDRRMQEMVRMMGQGMPMAEKGPTLLVNSNNPVVRNILDLQEKGSSEDAAMLVAQVYDLSMLTCKAFDQDRMASFLERSNKLLARIEGE